MASTTSTRTSACSWRRRRKFTPGSTRAGSSTGRRWSACSGSASIKGGFAAGTARPRPAVEDEARSADQEPRHRAGRARGDVPKTQVNEEPGSRRSGSRSGCPQVEVEFTIEEQSSSRCAFRQEGHASSALQCIRCATKIDGQNVGLFDTVLMRIN